MQQKSPASLGSADGQSVRFAGGFGYLTPHKRGVSLKRIGDQTDVHKLLRISGIFLELTSLGPRRLRFHCPDPAKFQSKLGKPSGIKA